MRLAIKMRAANVPKRVKFREVIPRPAPRARTLNLLHASDLVDSSAAFPYASMSDAAEPW